jgi:hypothetical protein
VEDNVKIKVLLVLIPAAVVLGCDASSHLPTSPATALNAPGTGGTAVGGSAGASGATALSGPEASSSGTASSRLVEIEGRVDSVTPPDLVVTDRRGPRTIRTSIATHIEKDDHRISLSQVLPGDQVEVEGVLLSDGSLLAREIEVEGEDEDENEVEFTGTIDSINVTDNVLVISGRTVIVTPSTVIKKDGQRVSIDQLVIGDRVEVEGVRLADGTILATELEVRDEDDEDDDDDDEEDDDDEDEDNDDDEEDDDDEDEEDDDDE